MSGGYRGTVSGADRDCVSTDGVYPWGSSRERNVPKYQADVACKSTGQESTVYIEASTVDDARNMFADLGLVVATIYEHPDKAPKRRVRLRPVLFEIGGVLAFAVFAFGVIAFLANGGKQTNGSIWDQASGTGLMMWLVSALLCFAVAELCAIADRAKG